MNGDRSRREQTIGMRDVDQLPYAVQQEDHVTITMSDGVRLSARIWRPTGSDAEPVPAILEAIPYRKNDLTSTRDAIHHPYIAGHGYACVRVDLRGTGSRKASFGTSTWSGNSSMRRKCSPGLPRSPGATAAQG